ncbi:MAG TPA: hypothetical protein VK348_05770, partial [Planctomycetota bacterium]|nr:hypothetical protein [Planctomycetota bacterium]
MRATRRSALSSILATVCTTATIALLAAFTATDPLVAQAQIQALYPLQTDLLDASNNYGPVTLLGTPPPAPPNNGVCVNGIYFFNAGGQDVRTPLLTNLDTTDFEIDVDFNIAAMPAVRGPVIMGGHLWRWLGIYLQSNGTVGIKHNNSNLAWSSTTLSTGLWYSASLKYERGTVVLFINGALVLQANVGPLSDGNNKNITTNDFSTGLNFNGCIRNLLVINDTTVLATAAPYGAGCTGSAGVPALTPTTNPQLGTTFLLNATNLPPAAVFAFLSMGFSRTTSLLGPLPLNLQPFGL